MVVDVAIGRLFLTKVFYRIGPQDIAHDPMGRRLSETVNLKNFSDIKRRLFYGITHSSEIIEGIKLRRQASMYA